MAFHASSQNAAGAPAASATPSSGYGYDSGAYDYAPRGLQRPTAAMMWLIVAGVAVVCLCCGLIVGGVFSYLFFPAQTVPVPTAAPTPSGLNLLLQLLNI
jgi:hypothetical protein